MSEDILKVKPFSGKEGDWIMWSFQFLARAEAKGYRVLLDGEETAPNDLEVLDPAAEANRVRMRKLNKVAYSELMTQMSKAKVAFMLVRKERTAGLPNGSAFEAWKNLTERYEPKGIESVEQVIEAYRACKLGKKEDPEEWITMKDEIRMRLQIDYGKKDYSDDDFKAAIVYDLPEKYHSEKAILKERYQTMKISDMVLML